MAVVIYTYDDDANETKPVGAIKDGEYHGDERIGQRFENDPLDSDTVEEQIAAEYNGRYMNAVKTDDAEVDVTEFATVFE